MIDVSVLVSTGSLLQFLMSCLRARTESQSLEPSRNINISLQHRTSGPAHASAGLSCSTFTEPTTTEHHLDHQHQHHHHHDGRRASDTAHFDHHVTSLDHIFEAAVGGGPGPSLSSTATVSADDFNLFNTMVDFFPFVQTHTSESSPTSDGTTNTMTAVATLSVPSPPCSITHNAQTLCVPASPHLPLAPRSSWESSTNSEHLASFHSLAANLEGLAFLRPAPNQSQPLECTQAAEEASKSPGFANSDSGVSVDAWTAPTWTAPTWTATGHLAVPVADHAHETVTGARLGVTRTQSSSRRLPQPRTSSSSSTTTSSPPAQAQSPASAIPPHPTTLRVVTAATEKSGASGGPHFQIQSSLPSPTLPLPSTSKKCERNSSSDTTYVNHCAHAVNSMETIPSSGTSGRDIFLDIDTSSSVAPRSAQYKPAASATHVNGGRRRRRTDDTHASGPTTTTGAAVKPKSKRARALEIVIRRDTHNGTSERSPRS